jgi:ParB family chromosome partitioning protein
MSTHLQVPLKNLKFGHEAPVHPSNARVTGRLDGIEALAANIHSRGQIEDLIVFDDGVKDTWFVSDGNRSLAALRMIYSEQSSQLIDCKQRPAEQAFEDSLAVAVMSRKLHPVDEYEGFARLRDDHDKTAADIANQYGMTEREVDQVLALGRLSPRIREAWRNGEIKTAAAKAFTMAPDHDTQDKILDDLKDDAAAGHSCDLADLDGSEVKYMMKIGIDNAGALVEFVGVEAYVARGGKVTRDLFGTDHKVCDVKLAKAMAAEKLAAECKRLKESGWSFAVTLESVKNSKYNYTKLKIDDPAPTPEEQTRLDELSAVCNPGNTRNYYAADSFAELTDLQQKAYVEYSALSDAIKLRAYTPKLMAKAGCVVGIDDDGFIDIQYGRIKPAQKETATKVEKEEKKDQAKVAAKTAADEGKPAPESKTLSNALKRRLEMTLVAATRDAIAGDPQLVNSPLFDVLAKVICAQIVAERAWGTPDAIRIRWPVIRQALNAGVFNAALAKRFDAENYFSTAPKAIVVKAIAEAINPDEARKAATGKSKAEIYKFALANLGKTGWLPKELRTVHYIGPGADGFKKPATAAKRSEAKADEKTAELATVKPAPVKKTVSAKNTVKKVSAKTPAKKKTVAKKRKAA